MCVTQVSCTRRLGFLTVIVPWGEIDTWCTILKVRLVLFTPMYSSCRSLARSWYNSTAVTFPSKMEPTRVKLVFPLIKVRFFLKMRSQVSPRRESKVTWRYLNEPDVWTRAVRNPVICSSMVVFKRLVRFTYSMAVVPFAKFTSWISMRLLKVMTIKLGSSLEISMSFIVSYLLEYA